jgi:hypothetical protein
VFGFCPTLVENLFPHPWRSQNKGVQATYAEVEYIAHTHANCRWVKHQLGFVDTLIIVITTNSPAHAQAVLKAVQRLEELEEVTNVATNLSPSLAAEAAALESKDQ